MSKLKKIIATVWLLIFMFLSFSVVVCYQDYSANSFYLISLSNFPFSSGTLAIFTFYFSMILFIVLFVLIIYTLFYPTKLTEFRFRKTGGVLRISKKAVEGIVTETLVAEKLMKNPKVNATMSQRKIKLKVKGDIQIVSDLYDKTNEWSEYLEKKLHKLIGTDVKISINIKFDKSYSEKGLRVK